MLVLLMLLPSSDFAEEKKDASTDAFQLGSSGAVSYSRFLDEGALLLAVKRFPAPKEAGRRDRSV